MIRLPTLLLLIVGLIGCAAQIPTSATPTPAPRVPPELKRPVPNQCNGLSSLAFPANGSPEYPRSAFKQNQEGWAQVEYDVEAGKVVRAHVIDSSPPEMFDEAAIKTTQSLVYSTSSNGKSCLIEHEYKIGPTEYQ